MRILIEKYKTLIFDCDGVILNSNKIKTQAFYDSTKHLGHEPAQALLDYHVQNGGISRYAKFEYFFTEILNQDFDETLSHEFLQRFAQAVKKGLMSCEVAEGLDELREKSEHANWLIVSGGDQAELRVVFEQRELAQYFDRGIFGSPRDKYSIVADLLETGVIQRPTLFLGDSRLDYEVAKTFDLDFVFINQWTEFADWRNYCQRNSILSISNIGDLFDVC